MLSVSFSSWAVRTNRQPTLALTCPLPGVGLNDSLPFAHGTLPLPTCGDVGDSDLSGTAFFRLIVPAWISLLICSAPGRTRSEIAARFPSTTPCVPGTSPCL